MEQIKECIYPAMCEISLGICQVRNYHDNLTSEQRENYRKAWNSWTVKNSGKIPTMSDCELIYNGVKHETA